MTAGSHPLPGSLLAVQVSAGNAAAVAVLRDPDGDGQADLPPAAVARARRWYAQRTALFSPELVARIRREVGLDPDGGVDDRLIHAVADWQSSHPPQPVDGQAGERTLAELFPSGLATEQAMGAYAGEADEAVAGWADLADREARMRHLLGPVNRRLQDAGVPACAPELPEEAATLTTGTFDHSTWSISVHDAYLGADPPDEQALHHLMPTLYHEARHAEQHFLVARYVAGQDGDDADADDIARRLHVPGHVARAAVADPLAPGGPEAVIAAGMHRSMHGPRFHALWRRRRAADAAAERAWARWDRNPTEANLTRANRASRRSDRLHEEYRRQSHEFDAFAVGARLREHVR